MIHGSMPWIKLYIEILSDPKMGRLSDHAWRRAVELFLIAGKTGAGGYLPPVEDIAWELRTNPDDITQTLLELQAQNIACSKDGEWLITHFSERQDADTNAEKQRRYRERKQKSNYYDNTGVTDGNKIVTDGNGEKRREEEEKIREDKRESAKAQPPSLPIQAQVFIDKGGKWPKGNLVDGTPKKEKAIAFMVEKIPPTPADLERWGRVVENYCLTWSATSYTVMVNDYFLQNRIPGQGRQNGHNPPSPTPAIDPEEQRARDKERARALLAAGRAKQEAAK